VVAGGAVGGDASQRISVIGDPRTNSLLVRSENPSKLNAVRQLVANLDQPGAAGNIHVVYLKNAEATKVAQTLRAVISGEAGNLGQSTGQGSTGSSAPRTTGTTTGSTTAGGMGNTPSFSNSSGNTSATGNGIVQADPMTNSLIITAPDAIYNNLRKVIDQLDKRRAQVYVEALITEVSTEKAAEIGIQWQAGKHGRRHQLQLGGNNILNLATSLASSSSTTLPGNGLNLLLGGGTMTSAARSPTSTCWPLPRVGHQGQHPVHAQPRHPRQRGGQDRRRPQRALRHRHLRHHRHRHRQPLHHRRAQGRRPDPQGQAADLRRRHRAPADLPGSLGGHRTTATTTGPSTTKRSIESTVLVDDGAVIALGGLVEDTYSGGRRRCPCSATSPTSASSSATTAASAARPT
jgi:general secretion pathway protein D